MTRSRTAMVPCTPPSPHVRVHFANSPRQGFGTMWQTSSHAPASLASSARTLQAPRSPKCWRYHTSPCPVCCSSSMNMVCRKSTSWSRMLLRRRCQVSMWGAATLYHQALARQRGFILSSASAKRPCSRSVVDTASCDPCRCSSPPLTPPAILRP